MTPFFSSSAVSPLPDAPVPIEVKMAKLSPTMESGQMVRWLVKVGDKVKEGDTLAEIQTDKAVMPMESFDEGTVAVLDVKEGDDIALGQRVLVLAKKGEDPGQVASQGAGARRRNRSRSGRISRARNRRTPRITPRSRSSPATAAGTATASRPMSAGGRVKSSPLARKIAAAAKVEIGQIAGSGPGGRIVRSDVESFLSSKPALRRRRPGPRSPPARRGGSRTPRCGRRSPSG